MAKKKIYGFSPQDAATLHQMAQSRRLSPTVASSTGGLLLPAQQLGAWILETTGTITAATYSTNTTPGSGNAKIQKRGSTYLEDHQTAGSSAVTRTLYSLWPHAVPSGFLVLGIRTLDGTLWAAEWLDRPQLFCRFTLGATLTTSDASKTGTIQTYYGFGKDHASSTATFNNLLTHTAGTYVFEGASGDAGLAYYTGSGTTWQIVQMECD